MTMQALVESSMSLFLFLWPVAIFNANRYQLSCLRTMMAFSHEFAEVEQEQIHPWEEYFLLSW